MRTLIVAGLWMAATMAQAHDGVTHKTPAQAMQHKAETARDEPDAPTPLPFDIGGPFELTDQTGTPRNQSDPDNRYQLLFFGYANCPSICSVAMPLMADVTTLLAARGIAVRPVMITVDPARDTVNAMAEPLAALHPDFVGLTGTDAALRGAYRAYGIEIKLAFHDPEYGEVFAHGSHIYLLDGAGTVLTLVPPVLDADRVAGIVASYAQAD